MEGTAEYIHTITCSDVEDNEEILKEKGNRMALTIKAQLPMLRSIAKQYLDCAFLAAPNNTEKRCCSFDMSTEL